MGGEGDGGEVGREIGGVVGGGVVGRETVRKELTFS